MSHDECYEALASLAALEQISPKEFSKLKEHLSRCGTCRAAFSELDSLVREKLSRESLSESVGAQLADLLLGRNQYRQRFLARAQERGIRFSTEGSRAPSVSGSISSLALMWNYKAAVVLLIVMTLSGLGYRYRDTFIRNSTLANQTDRLSKRNAELRQEVNALREMKASLEAELVGNRDAVGLSRTRANNLQGQLNNLQAQLNVLAAQLESAKAAAKLSEDREAVLQNRIREGERLIAQATQELDQLRASQQADAATITAQQFHIVELTESVKDYAENLDRERQLLAVDRDIRDVMGARNLHLVDVFDVDGRGKPRNIFGRIFYTEGKSLIFYAFDTKDRLKNAKHSFQAWGYREPAAESARSLGIFYMDDEKQKRWVLKFDNPKILEEIDAVFVTLERFGGAKRPSGQKLLYAYLRSSPNHP